MQRHYDNKKNDEKNFKIINKKNELYAQEG